MESKEFINYQQGTYATYKTKFEKAILAVNISLDNQNKINADRQAFEENRTAPIRAWSEVAPLATQMGSTFGTQTGQSTSTTKQSQSPLAMIGGGLMAGAGLLTGMPTMGMGGLGGPFGSTSSSPWQMPSAPYASNGMFNLNSLFGAR